SALEASLTRHGTHVNHACPPSIPSELHSSGPRLTRHRACVNHACPPSFPFTLDVELGWETIFHGDLTTLVLHTLVETLLVARILLYINHQNKRPQRRGKSALHSCILWGYQPLFRNRVAIKIVLGYATKLDVGCERS